MQQTDIDIAQLRSDILASAMESAIQALRTCLLINGGAAVALLAFIGHLVTQQEYKLIAEFRSSFALFVIGTFCVPIGHGLAYASNLYFALRSSPAGRSYRVAALIVATISVMCFLVGCLLTLGAFQSLSEHEQTKPATVIQKIK